MSISEEYGAFKVHITSDKESIQQVVLLTLVLNKSDAIPTSNFQPIRLLDPGCWYKFTK